MFFIILLFSCKESRNNENDSSESAINSNQKLELVQINLQSCFLYPSVIIFNLKDSSILFQHSGISLTLIEPPMADDVTNEVVEVFMPISFYFHVDSVEYSNLNDSIIKRFNEIDYQDTINYKGDDGGGAIMLFCYKNDSIKQVEIFNAGTENQFLLINKLIDLCLENVSDSLTKEYLYRLRN